MEPPSQSRTFLSFQKVPRAPCRQLPPPTKPLATDNLIDLPVLLFAESHKNELIQDLAFCVWLFALGLMVSGPTHIVPCTHLFLFIAEYPIE